MHESGVVDRLVRAALKAAEGRPLRAVHVRLGAMATLSPERLRADFLHVTRDHLGLEVELHVERAPERPSGIEITAVEVLD